MKKAEIVYCSLWGYEQRAASLADEIRSAAGIDPFLIPGSDGAFEVSVDGKLIFSKLQSGKFPEPGEILRLLNCMWHSAGSGMVSQPSAAVPRQSLKPCSFDDLNLKIIAFFSW